MNEGGVGCRAYWAAVQGAMNKGTGKCIAQTPAAHAGRWMGVQPPTAFFLLPAPTPASPFSQKASTCRLPCPRTRMHEQARIQARKHTTHVQAAAAGVQGAQQGRRRGCGERGECVTALAPAQPLQLLRAQDLGAVGMRGIRDVCMCVCMCACTCECVCREIMTMERCSAPAPTPHPWPRGEH